MGSEVEVSLSKRGTRRGNRLRQRFRLKRNFMFILWTLIFIYYNLNQNSEDSGFCASAYSLQPEFSVEYTTTLKTFISEGDIKTLGKGGGFAFHLSGTLEEF